MLILLLFIIINGAEGFWAAFWLCAIVFICECLFYYYSRFRKKYRNGIIANALISYIVIAINYFINAGINGPTIFLFLFSFTLLIAATPNRMHIYWLLMHLIIGSSIMIIDLNNPGLIKYNYVSSAQRFFDVLITCLVTLLFIFIISRYLRNHYLREKIKAEDSQIRLKAFFESTQSCHVLLNTQLEIIYFNHATAKFIRGAYDKEVSAGDNMETFVSYAYIQRFRENYYNALNGTKCTEERLLQYERYGKIWWQFSFSPVFNVEGAIIGVSFTCTNITIRKEHAENIRQKNKSLMQIAFLQSHELRQPVSSILGLINLIKEDKAQSPEYLRYMQDAINELDTKLDAIVSQTKNTPGDDGPFSFG